MNKQERQELIKYCEDMLNALRGEVPGDAKVLKVYSIALASLTAKPIGSFHIHEQDVEATTDYVKRGEWPIDNGELLVYAAPPAPDLAALVPELEKVLSWIESLPVPTPAATLNYGRVKDAIAVIKAAGGEVADE